MESMMMMMAAKKLFLRVAPKLLRRMNRAEQQVLELPDALRGTTESPERFDILGNALEGEAEPPMTRRLAPHMAGSVAGIFRSLRDLRHNPTQPRTIAPDRHLIWLESLARGLGCSSVGYARVPAEWVFRDKAIAFANAVVLAMPMDVERISRAPSVEAAEAVHETYDHLGQITNRLAESLRGRGYGAHAGPPLNGLALYPPLAQAAHLGWGGLHGLIISPETGSCQRLAVVYTSIENLPYPEGPNPHRWVEEFCQDCRACLRRCPAGAVLPAAIEREHGLKVFVDGDRCFPYFHQNHGCSVCIAVCPFTRRPYRRLKERLHRRQ